MKNDYEVRGEFVAIFLDLNGTRHETIIDAGDLQLAKEFPNLWKVDKRNYVYGHRRINGNKKIFSLHRYLTGAPKGMVVDHISGDRLDNRKSCNLRIVEQKINAQNRRGADKDSKSNVRGVYWVEKYNKWDARIYVSGKTIFCGLHEKLEDAEGAVIAARAVYMPGSFESRTIDISEAKQRVYKKIKPGSPIKSGIKGISWNTEDKTWIISFNRNNNRHYVGRNKSLEKAIEMLDNYKSSQEKVV